MSARSSGRGPWLRWSWRDLRQHWVAVVALALVLAIGIGVFAGLGSTSTWRRASNDASFAALGMHDLQVELSPGTFIDEGALLAAARNVADADEIIAISERLVVDSQLQASTDSGNVLVPARVVGMDLDADPVVDGLWVRDGVAPADGAAVGVLEAKFADHHDLAVSGTVTLAHGVPLEYTGLGVAPEDFYYFGPEGTIFSQGELATVYLQLPAAQELTGRTGEVNDLVLRLHESADRAAVRSQLRRAVDELGVSATVSTRDDADAYRVLYEDIDNDQRVWNVLSGLVLGAAALATFNLVGRIVESQRREIGIGMALGVPRRHLAIRPLLVGAQVALLGSLAGIGVGLLIGRAMQGLLESFLPLPEYRTDFQLGVYGRAAVLGLVAPILASAVPVWRAVRVEPVEAIRTGHLAARTSRFSDWTARVRLPGSSLTLMPLRNVLRTPRRTILTAVGVGAAITALVAVLGLLDSFGRTIDRVGDELTQREPDRVLVQLDTFHAEDSPVVTAVAEADEVRTADSGLRLPATATAGVGDDLDLLVELVDLDDATWVPSVEEAVADPGAGILLARKAAEDLGVEPGDEIVLRHPVRLETGGYTLGQSSFVVDGIHANPIRVFAFLDLDQADRFGLVGAVNVVTVYPTAAVSRAELQQALFGLPGVTTSQAVARISEGFDEALDQFVGFLVITAAAVLVLALLIAFNSSRITVDERRREHATMRAFGMPVRSVLGVVVKESVLVGLMATAIGVAAGIVFVQWMLRSLATTSLPDIGIELYLSPATLGIAAAVGIVAVAAAPLFLVRRLSRMDLPDTLRVME